METERLIIRRFKNEDWQDLYEYLSDEEVVRFEPYEPYSLESCKKEAIARAGHPAFLAVCLKDSGKLIGNIYFEKQDYGTYEIGYVFNAQYHGKGYATESAKAVIENGIKNFNVRRIVAMCNPTNEASWRLLERLNMRREGHLLQNIWFKNDEEGQPLWVDTYEYGILATEWR